MFSVFVICFCFCFCISFIAGTWRLLPSMQGEWASRAHSTTKRSIRNGPILHMLLQASGSLGCMNAWVRTCSDRHPSTAYPMIRLAAGSMMAVLGRDRAPVPSVKPRWLAKTSKLFCTSKDTEPTRLVCVCALLAGSVFCFLFSVFDVGFPFHVFL